MTSSDKKEETDSKVSRRDFLKYTAGAAAVVAGASAVLSRIPQTSNSQTASSPTPVPSSSSDPIVVMVQGDELTVMQGHNEAKIKDSRLAAEIAGKVQ